MCLKKSNQNISNLIQRDIYFINAVVNTSNIPHGRTERLFSENSLNNISENERITLALITHFGEGSNNAYIKKIQFGKHSTLYFEARYVLCNSTNP